MPIQKLPNYLRTYRKRACLSQDEIAYLLGCQSGAKVSRYERFAREPTLKTALLFEVIFRTPASELFGGVFQKVEREAMRRARLLVRKLEKANPDRIVTRKLEILRAIFPPPPTKPDEKL